MTVKSRFREQVPLFAAALVIAFAIWIMAKMGSLETRQINVPVTVANVPPNVNVELAPKNIPIIVRFPQNQDARVVPQNFEVRLDLAEVFGPDPRVWADPRKPTIQTATLTLDNVHRLNLPESVRVTDLGASSRIQIEASLITQAVPVKVVTTGSLPPNYEFRGELRPEPEEVRVTGSGERLREMTANKVLLETEPINLNGLTEDVIEYPSLTLPRGIELVNLDERKVQVLVGVREKEVSRTFEGVPIAFFVFSENLKASISPSVAQIRVKGPISLLDRLTAGMFVFAPKELLTEEPGPRKAVELEVKFTDDVPTEIRTKAEIQGWSPNRVDVEFVRAEPAKPR